MASNSSTTTSLPISSNLDPEFHISLVVLSSSALATSVIAVLIRLIFVFIIPISWKCSLILRDIASASLGVGLVMVASYLDGASPDICRSGGFFLLFGVMDVSFSLVFMALAILVIQDPFKMSQLSTFKWAHVWSIVLPQKIMFALLALLPVTPIDYFEEDNPYPVACFPIRQPNRQQLSSEDSQATHSCLSTGGWATSMTNFIAYTIKMDMPLRMNPRFRQQEGDKGATFGAILVFIVWILIVVAIILCVANSLRFHRSPSTRIHASSPSLWQTQRMEQGKTFHKFLFLDLILVIVMVFIVTIILYTNSSDVHAPQWIALSVLSVVTLVRSVVAGVQFFMWAKFCCNDNSDNKEPHHRLKQLVLIRNEGQGKLRLKANWTVRKGTWRQGLLKVYGPSHIKEWAKEIVVLGLLRKSRSASVLQCLWTSNSNPYYETMTLISGEIVTSDSRLTCLELTSGGTLQDLLKTLDVPLPEPCQKTIMHDIAEGLSYLHDQNVLHRNLTSAAVYLKGSVQCLVLRAAVGDFEDAQIYGTFLTGSPTSNASRKQFFFPDIRAFALVGIEMLSRICECRKRERQPNRRTATRVIDRVKSNTFKSTKHDRTFGAIPDSTSYKDTNNAESRTYDNTSHQMNTALTNELKRYEKPEIPYFAPGEAEYIPSVKENAVKKRESSAHVPSSLISVSKNINPVKDHDKDFGLHQNWMLQTKPGKNSPRNSENDYSSCDEYEAIDDRFKHTKIPGVTNVTKVSQAKHFEFPNNSVFKAVNDNVNDELDMIEEEIERNLNMKNMKPGNNYKHGGYVTSQTEDGREIFIPAVYKTKNSGGNSSSGYGSCAGSASIISEYFNSGVSSVMDEPIVSESKQVHKTVSAATVSSFGDDILEVLPALADEKPRTGEELLKELMKAKQDAKVEQLIESFKERFRRGELGKLDSLPEGIIFPKKDRPGVNEIPKEPSGLPTQIEKDLGSYDSIHFVSNESTSKKPNNISPRPKTAASSMNQYFNRNTFRPMSANNATVWNARNSLKRTKARQALKKALVPNNNSSQGNAFEVRGTRGDEVELKYARLRGLGNSKNAESLSDNQNKKDNDRNEFVTQEALPVVNNVVPVQTINNTNNIISVPSHHGTIHKPTFESQSSSNKVTRKPSTKTKPAPPPPRKPQQIQQNKQQITVTGISGINVVHDTVRPKTMESTFNDHESLTSGMPKSECSVAPSTSKAINTQSTTVTDINAKIQTDMNKIIQGEATNVENILALPPGIRLIDSGFDSESISSEESCLCAASALQPTAEDGSCSCPSEIMSQGTCSCACSTCLKESKRYRKASSWVDSQDSSESWSNSNSFSSYDTTMHRRKIPTKKDRVEPSGGALAPDQQYPSPVHRNKHRRGSNSLLYSPKRNRRTLSHMKGNYPSSASETSSAASRRYRELIKKGVPLRVSVVSGDEDGSINKIPTSLDGLNQTDIHTIAEHEKEESNEGSDMYTLVDDNDEADMDFDSNYYEIHDNEVEGGDENYHQISNMPSLDDIIKEIPDETGQFPDETRAFLNRPESEMSLKALQAVLSRSGSATDEKRIQDAERTIDRIFSSQFPQMHSTNSSLELDESAVKEIAMLPSLDSEDYITSDTEGLLSGMDGRHVRYCHKISSRIHLVNFNELLPANIQAFDQLKAKLQLQGNIGLIGTQLIDLIQVCWLNDTPPSTSHLVDKLTDNITETEL